MKYVEPKISVSNFEPVYTSGNGDVATAAPASALSYDVSVSYSEILTHAAQQAEAVLSYIN